MSAERKVKELVSKLDKLQNDSFERLQVITSNGSRALNLQELLRSFDKPPQLFGLKAVLANYEFSTVDTDTESSDTSEWILLARATVVVYGALLEKLFTQALPLGEDILYWEELLASRLWRSVYLLQSIPLRLYGFSSALARQAQQQLDGRDFTLGTIKAFTSDRTLFRKIAFPHLTQDRAKAATKFFSVDYMIRQEIKAKRKTLVILRESQARAIGILATETMEFERLSSLKYDISKGISMMEQLLSNLTEVDPDTLVADDVALQQHIAIDRTCARYADRIVSLADQMIPATTLSFRKSVAHCSRPGRLARHWPVLIVGLLAGPTVLPYISRRRQATREWVLESIETVGAFWQNWILSPISKIIATIRHDEGSEVALMSRKSLMADMESLERMVVDFARDNPGYAKSVDLEVVRTAVHEGDLTPVLMAYEENIKSPLKNAVTGSLIRSLLIQVQKTKVDVEVAINGIDKLLKSQELVFGFVGVSPAIVILWAGGRWLSGLYGKKSQLGKGQIRLNTAKILRNVERILVQGADAKELSYKSQGLLLCEVQVLRSYGKHISPSLRSEFLEDLTDLEDGKAIGVSGQRRTVERMWRVYGKFGVL